MKKDQISVLIADDEPAARSSIKALLEKRPVFRVEKECGDGLKAVEMIKKGKPDLVFLDIQMPEMNGFEVLRALRPEEIPFFIFVTAYEKYALQAFEESALDYLLKPYEDARFYRSLDKSVEMIEARQQGQNDQIAQLLARFAGEAGQGRKFLKKIPVKSKGKTMLLPLEDVLYIESSGTFVKIHFEDNFQVAAYSIKQLEELLDPAQFVRIHRSFMVHVDKVLSIEPYFHGDHILNLKTGKQLVLSRNYKEKLPLILYQS